MEWKVNVFGKEHQVNLPREIIHGELFEARIGEKTFLLQYNAQTQTFKCRNGKEESFHQVIAIRNQKFQKFEGDPVTTLSVELNTNPGIAFEAKVKPWVPGEESRAGSKSSKGAVVRSPITGKVLKVLCEKGQSISEGDTLLIIEAMKMENKIFASQSGVVASMKVKEGDAVTVGKELLTITDPSD